MSHLVLTVAQGESVIIGPPGNPLGKVTLGNKRLDGDKVRLRFDFPREVEINRESVAAVKVAEQLREEGNPA